MSRRYTTPNENRFDIRRASGHRVGDVVPGEQMAEARAFLEGYEGPGRFMASMKAWVADGHSISPRQAAAILQVKKSWEQAS